VPEQWVHFTLILPVNCHIWGIPLRGADNYDTSESRLEITEKFEM